MNWREAGSGPAVVLVHGSPLSSFSFRSTLARLSDRFRVLAPDLPGFGHSDKPPNGADLTLQRELLARWLDAVVPERFSLLGHDWGGPVGLAAAAPDRLDRLVLVNTTFRPDFRPPLYWRPFTAPGAAELLVITANVFGRGLPLLLRAARDPAVAAEYQRPLAARGARRTVLALERQRGWQDVARRAGATAPGHRTLLLWGTPDPYFRWAEVAWLQQTLPGCALHVLEGGGHFPQEDASDAFDRALGDFLDAA